MARVLIAEDDAAIAELESDYLAADGHRTQIAANGFQALAAAASGGFDLFIVDLMLPGGDGFTLCKGLRAASEKPIVVVSARASDEDKIRAFGLGADDYVTKPFSPAELAARVRAHLERYARLSGGRAETVLSAGGLSIDNEKKSVLVGGKPAQLTATEFAILLLLAKEPGKIFSKEEIFERIRGEGAYGDLGTITVHVRRLREKIEDDPSDPRRIETVWGMGYRFAR